MGIRWKASLAFTALVLLIMNCGVFAVLVGAARNSVNLIGGNLLGADLSDSTFTGLILQGATMPDGSVNPN